MRINIVRVSGIAALVGGVLFFLDFTLIGWLFREAQSSGFIETARFLRVMLWFCISVLLIGAPAGLLMVNAVGTGWRRKLAVAGTVLVSIGAASYITGSLFVYSFPDRPTRQIFTPMGSALLTLGMTLVSVSVMTARQWGGWRRLAVLITALYFPLQLPLQIAFFMGSGQGPNPFLLGVWGIFWALVGFAVLTAANSEQTPVWLERRVGGTVAEIN